MNIAQKPISVGITPLDIECLFQYRVAWVIIININSQYMASGERSPLDMHKGEICMHSYKSTDKSLQPRLQQEIDRDFPLHWPWLSLIFLIREMCLGNTSNTPQHCRETSSCYRFFLVFFFTQYSRTYGDSDVIPDGHQLPPSINQIRQVMELGRKRRPQKGLRVGNLEKTETELPGHVSYWRASDVLIKWGYAKRGEMGKRKRQALYCNPLSDRRSRLSGYGSHSISQSV